MAESTTTLHKDDPTNPGHYGPSQTALLLLDFHSAFIHGAGVSNGSEALQVAVKMRDWAKQEGIHVIHGLVDVHGTLPETLKDRERTQGFMEMLKQEGGEEASELASRFKDEVTFFRVPGYRSALVTPTLRNYLEGGNITSLIMVGIATSGVILHTMSSALNDAYVVTVLSDGCGDPDEALHHNLLHGVLGKMGYLMTAEEFQEAYKAARD